MIQTNLRLQLAPALGRFFGRAAILPPAVVAATAALQWRIPDLTRRRIAISWKTQDRWSMRRSPMAATFAERMSFRLGPLSPTRQFSPVFDRLLQQHN
jgi:hypothetical protein